MKYLIYFLTLSLMLMAGQTLAQVQFKIELMEDNSTYQVSMLPLATWLPPFNLTSTAQVTLKVPTGQFQPTNFLNLQPGVVWERNTDVISPAEAPDYDYFSFVLVNFGTSGLDYIANEEVPLFSFQNSQSCAGEISLFDNDNDPFRTPNSRQTNVGNHITTLGAKGDAYIGWVGTGRVDCITTDTKDLPTEIQEFRLYPNPTTEYINLAFEWTLPTQDSRFTLYDLSGRLVLARDQLLSRGNNQFRLEVADLPAGVYELYVEVTGWKRLLRQVVVMSP